MNLARLAGGLQHAFERIVIAVAGQFHPAGEVFALGLGQIDALGWGGWRQFDACAQGFGAPGVAGMADMLAIMINQITRVMGMVAKTAVVDIVGADGHGDLEGEIAEQAIFVTGWITIGFPTEWAHQPIPVVHMGGQCCRTLLRRLRQGIYQRERPPLSVFVVFVVWNTTMVWNEGLEHHINQGAWRIHKQPIAVIYDTLGRFIHAKEKGEEKVDRASRARSNK